MTLPTLILACRAHGLAEIDRLADVAEAQAALLAKAPANVSDAALRQTFSRYRVSPRQMDAALLIARALAASGMPPTIQQIGDSMGVSKVSAFEFIGELVRKGVLVKQPYRSRAMRFAPGVLAVPS